MIFPRRPGGREPAFNVPVLLLLMLAAMAGVHAARSLLDDETEIRLLLDLAFFPAPWSVAIGWASEGDVVRAAEAVARGSEADAARVTLAHVVLDRGLRPWSCLTYALLHGSWTHLGLNAVWLVAFGTSVVRRAGPARTLILSAAGALGGALAQWLSDRLGVQPMIGASAIVSGYMGAAATFIFRERAGATGTRWSFFANRNALGFLAVWLVVNLIFGAAAVPLGLSEGAIAWEAHVGGLLAGLVLFPLLDPVRPDGVFPQRGA